MRIETVRIRNIQSFYAEQEIVFKPGFNLLVGANNAGKTTVMDALMRQVSMSPHLSEVSVPTRGDLPNPSTEYSVRIEANLSEIRQLLGRDVLYLPMENLDFLPNPTIEDLVRTYLREDPLISYEFTRTNTQTSTNISSQRFFKGVHILLDQSPTLPAAKVTFTAGRLHQVEYANFSLSASEYDWYPALLSRIYKFDAVRRPPQNCVASGQARLEPNAANLAYCLNHLNSNSPTQYARFCALVRRIFPRICWVKPMPQGGNFSIFCMQQPEEARRDDLAIGLQQMGLGIGNVLAILYVMLASEEPQVIAIDEPNAFLHPLALRELLSILSAEGARHQYILTAHSSDVLTAVRPSTVAFLEVTDQGATKVTQVGADELIRIRAGLIELGINVTDLHAKSALLWVEGPTEELVIPDLLRHLDIKGGVGIGVVKVESTGTWSRSKRDIEEIVQIYIRLSTGASLLPPLVLFLFDGDLAPKLKLEQSASSASRYVKFLKRQNLESYLLNAASLQYLLASAGVALPIEKIVLEFERVIDGNRLDSIDGAVVICNVLSSVAEGKFQFSKTRDSPIIVDWILENEPAFIQPLLDELREIALALLGQNQP